MLRVAAAELVALVLECHLATFAMHTLPFHGMHLLLLQNIESTQL